MGDIPEVTSPEEIQRHSGYQAMQPVTHPSYWGVDLDLDRRPGVGKRNFDPKPWPNTRYPPERQPGEPAAPMHGRPNKSMPPVFGTTVPLQGLSGRVRRLAYRYPDHYPRHWILKLLGDRVDVWEHRARRYLPVAVPLMAIVALASRRSR
jgi:hypothetical protein